MVRIAKITSCMFKSKCHASPNRPMAAADPAGQSNQPEPLATSIASSTPPIASHKAKGFCSSQSISDSHVWNRWGIGRPGRLGRDGGPGAFADGELHQLADAG